MASKLFVGKDHSLAYSAYRPVYPKTLFDSIAEYHRESVSYSGSDYCDDKVLDIGCGTGQATSRLTNYYSNVMGIDASPTQIEMARNKHSNISFLVGTGEDLSFLPDNSVDLVTAAQAIHYMDRHLVYPEVKRVLKQGGTMAVFMYQMVILKNPKANDVFHELWSDTLLNYWDLENMATVFNNYKDLDFPFEAKKRVDDIRVEKTMPLDDLIGFASSWSAWRSYLREHLESNLLERTKRRLTTILTKEEDSSSTMVEMTQNFILLLGRNDKSPSLQT